MRLPGQILPQGQPLISPSFLWEKEMVLYVETAEFEISIKLDCVVNLFLWWISHVTHAYATYIQGAEAQLFTEMVRNHFQEIELGGKSPLTNCSDAKLGANLQCKFSVKRIRLFEQNRRSGRNSVAACWNFPIASRGSVASWRL